MEKLYGQFDLETIEKLADIINKKELSELTISSGDNTITIKGKKSIPAMPVPMAVAAPAQSAPIDSTLAASEASMAEEVSGKIVKSPIVGTFYSSPSPDKPPFVKTGDEVKKGDVIMIIESMKLMNEIQSEYDGVVEQILVSDGQAVEFDQPIMVIK
ncbi:MULTISPECIES: acetyl-CoA carboxylase biotin carboxyl carrier protein [Ruminococcus]|uniref:Biotin carboxyl carrier protein of acetyl-CoA carboxylase n=1 Tax=Ruminococcus flavefaciens TaxID=1265 RepID=A0A1M7KCM2_RUMFL|nr:MULTISPECIES: acetyl-CoA carboxylase biotin carboxyl carrier protein [Ruminococcus]MCR4795538.1 acetyl-CoA carboxylase biotin carboxyl carrier protein [Ruminococcus sp.]SHM62753.1 acetyl-CoA carboxylase biotin carboxyl carrier protein [Ruminococcus flavefaciens]